MSAELGLLFNLIVASGIWTVVSVAVDRMVPVFNSTCLFINCFEDGMTTLGMMLTAWWIILPIIWLGCLINYLVVKNNAAMQDQVI